MPLFFIILILAYIVGNSYIYYKMFQILSSYSGGIKTLLTILYWIGALSVFASFITRDWKISTGFAHNLYELGNGWLIFTLYMVILLLLFDILKIFNIHVRYAFYYSLFITLCALSFGYYRFLNPSVKVINIPVSKSVESYQHPFRIVAISDVHLGNGMTLERLKDNIELINKQNPDLILIGGDLIDNGVKTLYDLNMSEELQKLKAPYGIYMVVGNHEYISDIKESEKFIATTPIRLLRDTTVTIMNAIELVGRDDRMNHNRKTLNTLMADVDRSKTVILLDHQPYDLQHAVSEGIDLQFSGHTHRGQVWPLSLLTDHMFEHSYGMKQFGDTHVYVSSGLSLWGPPFRIGTQNEIVVFNLIPVEK